MWYWKLSSFVWSHVVRTAHQPMDLDCKKVQKGVKKQTHCIANILRSIICLKLYIRHKMQSKLTGFFFFLLRKVGSNKILAFVIIIPSNYLCLNAVAPDLCEFETVQRKLWAASSCAPSVLKEKKDRDPDLNKHSVSLFRFYYVRIWLEKCIFFNALCEFRLN